jgi:hypothetical protein
VRITNEGSSNGFGAFLRQRGADEGDILIAEFDLSVARHCCVLETTNYSMKSVPKPKRSQGGNGTEPPIPSIPTLNLSEPVMIPGPPDRCTWKSRLPWHLEWDERRTILRKRGAPPSTTAVTRQSTSAQ